MGWIRGWGKLPGVLVLLLALPLAGCDMFGFREWNWHQKLTVSVMTPDGIKSGSAVNRASFQKKPDWANITGHLTSSGLFGEAAVVDLGEGRFIFALLETDFFAAFEVLDLFFPEIYDAEGWGGDYEAFFDRIEMLRATAEVPAERYPLLVTFDDINNPASVKRVDPTNLAGSFGPGYRLEAITLSITDEPVTKGVVEKVLPWLNKLVRPTLIPDPPKFVSDALDPDIQYLTPAPFSKSLTQN